MVLLKFKNLLLLSIGTLSLTVIGIALITVFNISTLGELNNKNIQLTKLRVEALNSKFYIVQIQQFLTDVSATGDEDGLKDANDNFELLTKSLNSILEISPDLKPKIELIRQRSFDLLNTGKEMASAYLKSGRDAGNKIMKRPETGLDALTDKLSENMNELEKLTSNQELTAADKVNETQISLLSQTVILSFLEFLIMIGIFFTIFKRTKPLNHVADQLVENSNNLETASISISDSANSLTAANSLQASATQQTAASLEEIRAMVGKTAENSFYLQTSSTETNQSVLIGKQALDEVIFTIQEINEGQNKISLDVEKTNNEINKIVNLVTEISSKTKVINEIVFQTKLLSFNASVEAARAGENGRGFSVVAEEVGKLAELSGTAAKEISDLLETSLNQVKLIVDENKIRLSATMKESTDKISNGIKTANRCGESFEKIVIQMSGVNQTTNQTSSAIQETVKGLDEISKALEELNNATRSNAETSMNNTTTSQVLAGQVIALKSSIEEVKKVIGG